MGIHPGQQVVADFLTEGIEGLHVAPVRVAAVLCGTAVGHDDDEGPDFPVEDQVVDDVFADTVFVQKAPFSFSAADAVAENEHVVVFLLRIVGREIKRGGFRNLSAIPGVISGRIFDPGNSAAVRGGGFVFSRNLHGRFGAFGGTDSGTAEQTDQQQDEQECFHCESLLQGILQYNPTIIFPGWKDKRHLQKVRTNRRQFQTGKSWPEGEKKE